MRISWIIALLLAALCLLPGVMCGRKSAPAGVPAPVVSDICWSQAGAFCDATFQISNSLSTNITTRLCISPRSVPPGQGFIAITILATTNIVIRLGPCQSQTVTQRVALTSTRPTPVNGGTIYPLWTVDGF